MPSIMVAPRASNMLRRKVQLASAATVRSRCYKAKKEIAHSRLVTLANISASEIKVGLEERTDTPSRNLKNMKASFYWIQQPPILIQMQLWSSQQRVLPKIRCYNLDVIIRRTWEVIEALHSKTSNSQLEFCLQERFLYSNNLFRRRESKWNIFRFLQNFLVAVVYRLSQGRG